MFPMNEALQYQNPKVLLLIEKTQEETQGNIPRKYLNNWLQKELYWRRPNHWEVGSLISESNTGKTYDLPTGNMN